MFKHFALGMVVVAACVSPSGAQVWTQRLDMPSVGRHHPVTFVLNGFGYAVTGSITTAGYSDDFYRYDPVNNTWAVLPDFPGPDRSYSYGGAYNGKGYMGFGLGTAFLADLWQYDPVSQVWSPLASCPGVGRTHPAFVITDNGKIFAGMGGVASGNLRDWWEYNIASNTWTQRADLPGPTRHHPFYFNIGNVPYVGFGHGAGIFRDFYRFDPVSLTWTRMNDFPGEGRVAGTQFTYEGKGYILSGEGSDHVYLDTGEFWEYDSTDDSWHQLTPHPGSGRWAPGSFVIDDMVYLTCGTSTVRQEHDLWRLDLTTVRTDVPAGPVVMDALTLYPNPVAGSELRMLRVPDGFEGATAQLLSPDGRRVQVLENRSSTLELPRDLASGQYFVLFTAPDGTTATRKITVMR